jgi:hypothetical protein
MTRTVASVSEIDCDPVTSPSGLPLRATAPPVRLGRHRRVSREDPASGGGGREGLTARGTGPGQRLDRSQPAIQRLARRRKPGRAAEAQEPRRVPPIRSVRRNRCGSPSRWHHSRPDERLGAPARRPGAGRAAWRSSPYWRQSGAGTPLANIVTYILELLPRTFDDDWRITGGRHSASCPGRCRWPLDWRNPEDLSPIVGSDSARRVLASSPLDSRSSRVDLDELQDAPMTRQALRVGFRGVGRARGRCSA